MPRAYKASGTERQFCSRYCQVQDIAQVNIYNEKMIQYHGEKSYKSTLEKNTFLLYCPVYNFLMCIQLSSNSPARQVRYYYFHFIDEETET